MVLKTHNEQFVEPAAASGSSGSSCCCCSSRGIGSYHMVVTFLLSGLRLLDACIWRYLQNLSDLATDRRTSSN